MFFVQRLCRTLHIFFRVQRHNCVDFTVLCIEFYIRIDLLPIAFFEGPRRNAVYELQYRSFRFIRKKANYSTRLRSPNSNLPIDFDSALIQHVKATTGKYVVFFALKASWATMHKNQNIDSQKNDTCVAKNDEQANSQWVEAED